MLNGNQTSLESHEFIRGSVNDCSNSSDDEIAELISDINSIIDVRLKCYSPDLVRTLKFIIIQNIG